MPTPLWKPGQSGNPKGRPPKEWTMSTLIEEALEEQLGEGVYVKKAIATKLAQMAIAGDIQAIKEVNDRIDGKPRQSIEMSGTIEHNVVEIPTKRDLEAPPETS